jgi:hypothetical protein
MNDRAALAAAAAPADFLPYTITMVLAALIMGLVTAYYFGVRLGVTAAASAFLLFALALVAPAWAFWCYAVAAVGFAGVCALGPRFGNPGAARQVVSVLRYLANRLRDRLR